MDRDQLVKATYKAGLSLNRLKAKYGLISPKRAASMEKSILLTLQMVQRIDKLVAWGNENELSHLAPYIDWLNIHPH